MQRHIKLRLRCVSATAGVNGEAVVLAPHIDSGGRENETFHNAETLPTAAMSFTVTNGDAKGVFQAGKDYLMQIKPVET